MGMMQKRWGFFLNCMSQTRKEKTIRNGRPGGHSFDHRLILLYFGGKMSLCSLWQKQKTWREAFLSFSFKNYFMKSREYQMTRNLFDEDYFWFSVYFTCKEGICLIKLDPVQNKLGLFLVLVSKTYNISAAHAWWKLGDSYHVSCYYTCIIYLRKDKNGWK